MPRHEITLITKLIDRNQKVTTLKEIVTFFLEQGHNVRSVQSLGDRCLPYAMKSSAGRINQGCYFVLDADFERADLPAIKHKLRYNQNVIKSNVVAHELVHKPEVYCAGMQMVDYAAKLEELRSKPEEQKKYKRSNLPKLPFPL